MVDFPFYIVDHFRVIKMACLFVAIFMITDIGYAQTNRENYTQNLVGTDFDLELIFIEAGNFKMGSSASTWGSTSEELPQHKVDISAFWISEIEITWDLYNLFVNRKIDVQQSSSLSANEVDIKVDGVTGATTPYVDMSFGMGVEGYPAICMTQLAALRFCQWLSAITGNFYRLPTEAEWEYSCRAGSTTLYSFGDDLTQLSDHAWFSGNSEDKTQKVGQLKPNAWGLYDMHGNVAEWTLDQYDPEGYKVAKDAVKDPLILSEKTYPKAVRGGSWRDDPVSLRSASRMPSSKKWKLRDPQIPKSKWWHTDAPFVGFRVVRPLHTPTVEEQNKYWKIKLN